MAKTLSEYKLESRFRNRIFFSFGLFVFVLTIFFFQLFHLQILNGKENKLLSKRFVSREEYKVAPRGNIYDKDFNLKEPLVYNVNYLDFVLYPSRFPNYETGIKYILRFCEVMGIDCQNYSKYFQNETWKTLAKKNEKIILLHKVSREQQERLVAFQFDSEYSTFEGNHIRYYPLGPYFAHVSGYVGLPSRKEVSERQVQLYQITGKDGLELFYNDQLQGKDGIFIHNKIFEQTEYLKFTQQGNHLVLNIDKKLQIAAYRALVESQKRGTVIVLKAATGEILALASYPSYDPNILSDSKHPLRNEHLKIVKHFNSFLNLAIQSKFPPASTFKLITSIAALEQGNPLEINENTTYFCPGHYRLKSTLKGVPDAIYLCHKREGHGTLNLVQAIAQSCNVYFYQLGLEIGPTPIIKTAQEFHLNQQTGIDLPGEVSGFVPDQMWKQIRWSNRWYDGDTVNLSIGQGFIEVTPIAMAMVYAAIANKGKLMKPFIVREIRDSSNGKVLRKYEPQVIKNLKISEKTLQIVQKGLREVVLSGTGKLLNQPGLVPIAGKTGTVQTRSKAQSIDHAWFIGYAPYSDDDQFLHDRIVVAVFVEHGLAGSASGVPIALKIFKEAFPKWENPNSIPTNPVVSKFSLN
ncbi:MAG: penicillin-binding protein 2 [Leptospiraceae bacterium]|nr:penicillin-binding protein 2 [Leptospiraceae bacterium]MDW7977093.1 penicillin-binding protein 2 [Leptospiraceae bacterium]